MTMTTTTTTTTTTKNKKTKTKKDQTKKKRHGSFLIDVHPDITVLVDWAVKTQMTSFTLHDYVGNERVNV